MLGSASAATQLSSTIFLSVPHFRDSGVICLAYQAAPLGSDYRSRFHFDS